MADAPISGNEAEARAFFLRAVRDRSCCKGEGGTNIRRSTAGHLHDQSPLNPFGGARWTEKIFPDANGGGFAGTAAESRPFADCESKAHGHATTTSSMLGRLRFGPSSR